MYNTRLVERSHPAFRTLQPIEERCGRFSVEEIRNLVPQDLRKLGCPEAVFLGILESRAEEARCAGRSYRPAAVTDAEIRERARQLVAEIAASDAEIDAHEAAKAARLANVPLLQNDPAIWEP